MIGFSRLVLKARSDGWVGGRMPSHPFEPLRRQVVAQQVIQGELTPAIEVESRCVRGAPASRPGVDPASRRQSGVPVDRW
jgi:hypothetical protein